MTIYYVDSSSAAASDQNSGLSANSPFASLDAVNKLKLNPGDTVAFAAGSVYTVSAAGTGALNITASGTATAPITFTTYGTGAAPVINNTANGYSDAILVNNSKYVVIDGLKLGDAGQAGIDVTKTSSHITIQNVEATNVGEGVMLNGTDNLVTHSYFHDLNMIKNTANVADDDYGATGIVIGNSNNEVSFNLIVNAKAQSYDYGTDGGGIELFGTMSNVSIHDNWVENSAGFIEAGGSKSTLSNISITNNVSLNNGTFIVLHNGGGSFASTFTNVDASHNTVVEQNNTAKQMASVFLDAATTVAQFNFHDNAVYLNNGDSFFKQTGSYHSGNVFYAASSATHLYNNWSMALNSGEHFATLKAVSGQSIVQEVDTQSGGAGSTLTESQTGIKASAPTVPSPPQAVTVVVGGNTVTTTYDAAGAAATITTKHADGSSDVYAVVAGKTYAATLNSYDSTGKLTVAELLGSSGNLLSKTTYGTNTTTDTYSAAGAKLTEIVQHADKSYDSYTFGVTGKSYTSSLASYDASGKLTATQLFDASGNLLSKTAYGTDTTIDTYNTVGIKLTEVVQHADKSYDSYTFGVTGKSYTSSMNSYDSSGKAVLTELFGASGNLLSKTVYGIDTTTDTYSATGAHLTTIVQHADKSYDSYNFGVTGKAYTSSHNSYDSTGKATLTELFGDSGNLLSKTVFGIDTTTDTYSATGAHLTEIVQHADKSYDSYNFGVTGKTYTSSHNSYDSTGKATLTELFGESGNLLSKTVFGTDTTTDTYSATGAHLTEIVQHADKSYDSYAFNVAGKSYTSSLNSFDSTGKALFSDLTNVDGSHAITVSGSNFSLAVGGGTSDAISLTGHNDTFVFDKSLGNTSITGFHAGNTATHDVIDLNASLVSDYTHLTDLMHGVGHDTVIAISASEQITLKGVTPDELTAANFHFHYDLA